MKTCLSPSREFSTGRPLRQKPGRCQKLPAKAIKIRIFILLGLLIDVSLSLVLFRAISVKGMAMADVNAVSSRLPMRGLYVQFERRGWRSMYYSGEAIRGFNDHDLVVGHTIAKEIALQLDRIRALGVNTITFELRASDPTYDPGPFVPPVCNMGPSLGLLYPQPTSKELVNLVAFYDLVQSKGMKILLRLANTHMEEQPPTNNRRWLKAILSVIKNHPAFELASFEGSTHLVDTDGDGKGDICGLPAEPPLWLGPKSKPARYVKWAIQLGLSLGIPARKLTAEAIVGDFFVDNEPGAGPDATDGHLWRPIAVLKGIFDGLSIPDNQRTYAISLYEHRKCLTARGLPCVEEQPDAWADETLKRVFDTIGRENGARVIAVEMGLMTPVVPGWTTEEALKSLVLVMQKHHVEGGSFWQWVCNMTDDDTNPAVADAIKRRGVAFVYNPVKDVMVKCYAMSHAVLSPNGGEKWKANTPYTIRWTYSGDLGPTVKIELLKGAAVDRLIVLRTPIGANGEGSYRWKIPGDQALGSNYKIRITSRKYTSYIDTSDRYFKIIK